VTNQLRVHEAVPSRRRSVVNDNTAVSNFATEKSDILPPSSASNPRLVNPRRPVRKGVKPPTRGEPVAFKLTTKTDTDDVQGSPPLPPPPPQSNANTSSGSPNLVARPGGPGGPGGVPNFAAQALNVQLKKTAGVKRPLDSPGSAPLPPPAPSAKVPPPVPPRKARTRSHTTGDMPENVPEIKEEGKEGYLHKRGGIFKGWKKRWFVLKDSKLYYYSSQKTDSPKGVITDVLKVDKHPSKDKDFCFSIYSPKRTYLCSADSSYDLEAWLEKISTIIKKQ